jgi:hypothetical protein
VRRAVEGAVFGDGGGTGAEVVAWKWDLLREV